MGAPTLWVSRPIHRTKDLSTALLSCGLQTYIEPAILIADAPDKTSLQQYLNQVEQYDLSIFVSVEAASRIAHQIPIGPPIPALAIGDATAAALPSRYHLQQSHLGIQDSHHLLQMPILKKPQCLAILGGTGKTETALAPLLCQTLHTRGSRVEPIYCYQRLAAPPNKELIQQGISNNIHGAIAFSSETLENMLAMTAPNNNWLRHLPLFVIHDNIKKSALKNKFKKVIVTHAQPTAMATQIASYYKN